MASSEQSSETDRSLGLWDATGVGVGAIVGGGILALAGVAFATTGPAAMLAFGLNGVIALLTALSFAEMCVQISRIRRAPTRSPKRCSRSKRHLWWAGSSGSRRLLPLFLYAVGFAYFVIGDDCAICGSSLQGSTPEWLSSPGR